MKRDLIRIGRRRKQDEKWTSILGVFLYSLQAASLTDLHDGFLQTDPRTGQLTAITGPSISPGQRKAFRSTDRRRTRGILEGGQQAPARESCSLDVWTPALERKYVEWGVSLVPLERLGVEVDDGLLVSKKNWVRILPSGAEASPFLDLENGVVYKLFDLRETGALGKRLSSLEWTGVGWKFECETRL